MLYWVNPTLICRHPTYRERAFATDAYEFEF